VGGIGIMNIMLASINERIRQIGICKAVGATGLSIFTQVLIESIVIALLGAALGVAIAVGIAALVQLGSARREFAAAQARMQAQVDQLEHALKELQRSASARTQPGAAREPRPASPAKAAVKRTDR